MLYRLSKEDNTIELMPYADFESLAKKRRILKIFWLKILVISI